MTTPRTLIAVAALLVLSAAACTGAPTSTTEAHSATAAFDGGHTFGSGNRTAGNATTAADPQGTATVSTDSTQRGGHTFGSGN